MAAPSTDPSPFHALYVRDDHIQSRLENPWKAAIRSLSEEDKAAIETCSADKLAVLENVLAEVEEKKQLCMQNRWKFKRSNGENVVIRDVFEKITRWVDKFKQIGDTAAQYDPVHTALPWAGVRFLLQVSPFIPPIFHCYPTGKKTS